MAPQTVDVQTAAGPVRGLAREGSAAFYGIPFAQPPVGPLRYAAPVVPEPWSIVRDCTRPGATAQRRALFPGPPIVPEPSIPGDDILTVNVFTPSTDRSGALAPVLIWIHGGGYVAGSAAGSWFDGRTYNRDGVVLVTVGYRLGFEGFGVIDGAPSNRAVRDWVAALEWVQREITRFGGDPARVTISGQSAGGNAVLTLLASERAQSLFAQAIAQSPAMDQQTPAVAGARTAAMAAVLGIEPTAESFAALDVDAVLEAQWAVAPMNDTPEELTRNMLDGTVPGMPFCPVPEEGWVAPIDAAYRVGVGADKRLLIGATAHEFAMLTARMADYGADVDAVGAMVSHGFDPEAARRYVAAAGDGSLMAVVGQLMSDRTFRAPVDLAAELRPRDLTWVYEFRWRSPLTSRATHCMEMPFTFDCVRGEFADNLLGTDPPQGLADRMHAAWVAFVTTGDPGWAPYGAERLGIAFDDPESAVVVDPFQLPRETLSSRTAL